MIVNHTHDYYCDVLTEEEFAEINAREETFLQPTDTSLKHMLFVYENHTHSLITHQNERVRGSRKVKEQSLVTC